MSWFPSRERKEFLRVAINLKEELKRDLTYEYQQMGLLPTPERCKAAAKWLEAECERQGVKATANIRASGLRVSFVIKDKNGTPIYENGTSMVLEKLKDETLSALPPNTEYLSSSLTIMEV